MIKYYATGRRKESSARVFISEGTGVFSVNRIPVDQYFLTYNSKYLAKKVLLYLKKEDILDVCVTVKGGGMSAQSGAIFLGLSRALSKMFPHSLKDLRDNGFLTCDSRVVERKKYGRTKARRGHQFVKR